MLSRKVQIARLNLLMTPLFQSVNLTEILFDTVIQTARTSFFFHLSGLQLNKLNTYTKAVGCTIWTMIKNILASVLSNRSHRSNESISCLQAIFIDKNVNRVIHLKKLYLKTNKAIKVIQQLKLFSLLQRIWPITCNLKATYKFTCIHI